MDERPPAQETTRGRRARRRRVLVVAPPITRPLTNGSAVLAHHLGRHGARFAYQLLGDEARTLAGGTATVEAFYAGRRQSLSDRARLLGRLARPGSADLAHLFFTPRPAVARATRGALGLSRLPSVQTIPSQPALASLAGGGARSLLFGDRVVAVSDATALLLRSAGAEDVRVIRPGVPVPPEAADRAAFQARCRARLRFAAGWGDAPVFVYAGDLEFSNGARVFADAARALRTRLPDARFVWACRPKTAASHKALRDVKTRVWRGRDDLGDRAYFLGVVDDMQALLGAADAVALPVDTLHAKVDFPFVALEALAVGTPVVVSDLPAFTELRGLVGGAAVRVTPSGEAEAVAQALAEVAGASGDERAARGRGAREAVRLHFGARAMVDAYEALYDELLGAGGAVWGEG